MTNPRLMIMDEPSEGLAPIMIEAVAEQLQRLKEGAMSLRGSAGELEADDEVKARYLGVGVQRRRTATAAAWGGGKAGGAEDPSDIGPL